MSRKVSTFTNIIAQPLNLYNFQVVIPGISDENIQNIVSSTVFPGASNNLRIVEKYFKGERIQYPTIPQNGGTWPITVPESDSGHTSDVLQRFHSMLYDPVSGAILPAQWRDLQVYAMPQNATPGSNIPEVFSCILHGAWMLGRGDVQLAANNVQASWDWQYTFVYQWLEPKSGSYQGATNPYQQ